ncbi:hypothetical protein ACOSQ3_003434 [Xanthoceras sorbifolium]
MILNCRKETEKEKNIEVGISTRVVFCNNTVFNYDRSFHNVAVVGVNEYKSCTSSPSSKTYSSGRDRIKLSKGKNYFICSVPTHCNSGLNIAVDAS